METLTGGLGSLEALPDCLLSYILSLLDASSLARLACVSRVLQVWACEEALWQALALAGFEGPFRYYENWRQTALRMLRCSKLEPLALQRAAHPPAPVAGMQSLFLYKRWYRAHMDVTTMLPPAETLARVDGCSLSSERFLQLYDLPMQPVILQGLLRDWPLQRWDKQALLASCGDALFRVSKPSGGRMLMPLPAYQDYLSRQADEEPLYVFDSAFGEAAPQLLALYSVPHLFAQDLHSCLGARRPDYRWMILGPGRSGASWHVDPALTSAWNALAWGRKRWALYPPHTVPPGVTLHFLQDPGGGPGALHVEALSPLQWFLEVYPTLPAQHRPVEFVQQPGELVYVPGGWWHCVLNLEESLAVTHNFVSDANLQRVVRYMARGKSHYFRNVAQYYSQDVRATFCETHSGRTGGAGRGGRKGRACNGGQREQPQLARGGVQEPAPPVPAAAAQAQQQLQQHGDGARPTKRTRLAAVAGSDPQQQQQQQQQQQHPDGVDQLLRGRGLADQELGCWLAGVWEQQPLLQPVLQRLCEQELGTAAWRQVLEKICSKAQLRAPGQRELLPTSGTSGLVFCVGDAAIKVFTEQAPADVRSCSAGGAAAAAGAGFGGAAAGGAGVTRAEVLQAVEVAAGQVLRARACPGLQRAVVLCTSWGSALHCVPASDGSRSGDSDSGSGADSDSDSDNGSRGCSKVADAGAADGSDAAGVVAGAGADGADGADADAPLISAPTSRQVSLPFTIMPRVAGWAQSLRALQPSLGKDQLLLVAQELGRRLGQLHSSCVVQQPVLQQRQQADEPQQHHAHELQASCPRVRSLLQQLSAGAAFWHDRDGRLWLGEAAANSSASGSSSRSSGRGDDGGCAAGSASSAVPPSWQPFVEFLRHRRSPQGLQEEGALPGWLEEQVEGYLPPDPAALLGLCSGGSSAAGAAAAAGAAGGGSNEAQPQAGAQAGGAAAAGLPQPCLLHGDLTSGNVLVCLEGTAAAAAAAAGVDADAAAAPAGGMLPGQQQGQQGRPQQQRLSIQLLDFADAGVGDPLWDFIALGPACLSSDPTLLSAFWSSYRQHCAVQRVWPRRGQLQLSYCAMCYSLLHEEALLERAYDARPELWALGSLAELQRALWGVLDEEVSDCDRGFAK